MKLRSGIRIISSMEYIGMDMMMVSMKATGKDITMDMIMVAGITEHIIIL
jgi:hypothetical protein